MAKVIHSMIRVLDLDKSLKFYADVLGLHEAHRLDFPDFALVYLRNATNDVEIELTLNKGRTEPYTHGTGYGIVGDCTCHCAAGILIHFIDATYINRFTAIWFDLLYEIAISVIYKLRCLAAATYRY